MLACNVCGGTEFKDAPFGRKSRTGLPPVCTNCGSLERHRVFRQIFLAIRDRSYKEKICLQFSSDPSTAAGWFLRRDTSIYQKSNSLDVRAINLPDESYDIVVCNHVLEHVDDYKSSIKELCRIVKRDGFLFVSFPNPFMRATTEDWGYPKPEQHGHYRIFGRDVESVFVSLLPATFIIAVTGKDPVTDVEDMAYILTRSPVVLERVLKSGCQTRLVSTAALQPSNV